MKAIGLFVAGTDTGVGKTWCTVGLVAHLRALGRTAVAMKPVECGGREDSLALRLACGGDAAPPLDEINPYSLPDPLAPASMRPPPQIDFARILAAYRGLAADGEIVLVEGAGGWLVPLDRERTMADLAAALGLPVLVVAANRLGVLNHTLLTVRAIRAAGLECRGVFLNDLPGAPGASTDADPSRRSNARVLRDLLPGLDVFERDPAQVAALFPRGS